jgi:hypothetical protein
MQLVRKPHSQVTVRYLRRTTLTSGCLRMIVLSILRSANWWVNPKAAIDSRGGIDCSLADIGAPDHLDPRH